MQCVESICVISKAANCRHWLYSRAFVDALRDLVPFVEFKECEKHPWGSNAFRLAILLKLMVLHGCFSRFLNCTNDTKL